MSPRRFDDPSWVRHLLSVGRTYTGDEIPLQMVPQLLAGSQVVEVQVGASAFGSSSVRFRRAEPENQAEFERRPGDYLIHATAVGQAELDRLNDNDWDSGREFWSYHRQAERYDFRGPLEERRIFKRSMAVMLATLMEHLAFPYRAWSISHRELSRIYAISGEETIFSLLAEGHWSPRFVFDAENLWEGQGDYAPMEELLGGLRSELPSYLADIHSEAVRDPGLSSRVASILSSGARRWATEAIWAARHGWEGVPDWAGLFPLPPSYRAARRPGEEALRELLASAFQRLEQAGRARFAFSCLVLLLRLAHWSLAPQGELRELLLEIHHWCMEYDKPEGKGDRLAERLRALTGEAVLLKFSRFMDGTLEGWPALERCVELSGELGRAEFRRLVGEVGDSGMTAEQCGQWWREATLHELLQSAYIRLRSL